jgi:hypothetical protein
MRDKESNGSQDSWKEIHKQLEQAAEERSNGEARSEFDRESASIKNGPSLVSYCLDLGVRAGLAWARVDRDVTNLPPLRREMPIVDRATGKRSADDVMSSLIQWVKHDATCPVCRNGVVVGLEAPLWMPMKAHSAGNSNFNVPDFSARVVDHRGNPHVEEPTRAWYSDYAAASSIKALAWGAALVDALSPFASFSALTSRHMPTPGQIAIFEAYVTGAFKVRLPKTKWETFAVRDGAVDKRLVCSTAKQLTDNAWDAFCGALGCWVYLTAPLGPPFTVGRHMVHHTDPKRPWQGKSVSLMPSMAGPRECVVIAMR